MVKIETVYPNDPILIEPAGQPRQLLLRIGEGTGSRTGFLSISQARIFAYRLLAEAERIGASDKTS